MNDEEFGKAIGELGKKLVGDIDMQHQIMYLGAAVQANAKVLTTESLEKFAKVSGASDEPFLSMSEVEEMFIFMTSRAVGLAATALLLGYNAALAGIELPGTFSPDHKKAFEEGKFHGAGLDDGGKPKE